MSNTPELPNRKSLITKKGLPYVVGILLISIGMIVLLDQFLQTGWLVLIILPISGVIFLEEGIRTKRMGLIIPGTLAFGAGVGSFIFFSSMLQLNIYQRIGYLLLCFGLGWVAITISSIFLQKSISWWALIPASVIGSTGLTFLYSDLQFTDFVFWIVTGLGVSFLLWGVSTKLIGLVIPGSLLTTIGPGIYFAWGQNTVGNALAQTGIMLVIFSLGWGLIILFSKMIIEKFVWWPLIPGGVMAMVGWGLYIGGDPNNAVSFIANTGSIGLIIFGLYLLLLRKSIHK